MDLEIKNQQKSPPSPLSPSSQSSVRAKTALRISYETEVDIIRKKIGSIDEVREKLGLSRRKMCQLLLVDPSAWTRWGKNPKQVPPHIYRSLQWYLALIEQQPEWHPKNTYLGAFGETQYQIKKMEKKIEEKLHQFKLSPQKNEFMKNRVDQIHEKNQLLGEQLAIVAQSQRGWQFLLLANTVILLWMWFSQFL